MLQNHLDQRQIGRHALPGPGVPRAAEDLPLRPVRPALRHWLRQKEAREVAVVRPGTQQRIHHARRSCGDDLDAGQEDVRRPAFDEAFGALAYGSKAGELHIVCHDEPPRRTWLTKTSSPLTWSVASSARGLNSPSTT